MPRARSPQLTKALALVAQGLTAYAAAKQTGVEQSSISRALRQDARPLCPHCGRPMP